MSWRAGPCQVMWEGEAEREELDPQTWCTDLVLMWCSTHWGSSIPQQWCTAPPGPQVIVDGLRGRTQTLGCRRTRKATQVMMQALPLGS